MNLINRKLLNQKIQSFEFPTGDKWEEVQKLIINWQKALKDSDLEKTKEKSVQGKFLSTFFEAILDYSDVTSGNEEWTLIQHPRIENDSKEPDGSLGWFTKDKKITRAVIELKDARTQLDKKQNRGSEKLTPIEQAYLYSTKYDGCNWIIVSNFKEIRLYNKHKTQEYFEKFDVLDLNQDSELKRFYYLLCKVNLITKNQDSLIDTLAKDTTEAELDITKKFYAQYKHIRLDLLGHLTANNPNVSKEILIEKTQKLLDRFIFTLFCEDTSTLLPLNLVKNTYERAMNSLSPSDERVWNEFKGLFLAIDKGNDRVKPPINAYNGGLFAFDETLDNLSIKDTFWGSLMSLADYDFETDLNVNILGHIFEQSISDLEEIKMKLLNVYENTNNGDIITTPHDLFVEKKGRRKKEGIFYTPEYITRYIVENTVGKYLEEHPNKLESIKILDPACGSGAFLNQAHSFLTQEYKSRYEAVITEKQEKDEAHTLFDFNPAENNKSILLNNLYGVDLNQESVEITKLALWLKTARSTEPLQNLDKNIKNGNSLIDDYEIAGNKAFNWKTEFSEIMNEGGFDVIIGNPPYVRQEMLPTIEKKWMSEHYSEVGNNIADLYVYFFAQAIRLLNDGGYLGFIAPNKWMERSYGTKLRNFLKEFEIISITNYGELKIFDDASTETAIVILKKRKNNNPIFYASIKDIEEAKTPITYNYNPYSKDTLSSEVWKFIHPTTRKILDKFKSDTTTLGEYVNEKIYRGLLTGLNEAFIISKEDRDKIIAKDPKSAEIIRPMVEGDDFDSWNLKSPSRYIILTGFDIDIPNTYRGVFDWLSQFQEKLEKRQDKGKNWWNLRACDYYDEFKSPKIVYYHTALKHKFYFDTEGYYISANCYFIANADRFTQVILNSNFFNYAKRYLFPAFGDAENGGRARLDANKMYAVTIPITTDNIKNKFEKLSKEISVKSSELYKLQESTISFIKQEYGLSLSSSQISRFAEMGWNQITELLNKQKIKMSIEGKEAFNNWLKEKQNSLLKLKQEVSLIEGVINQEVYKLYNLTEDEIRIIENS